MAYSDRSSLISAIEKHRKSRLISYVGSTRAGADYPMQQFDIRVISEHLRSVGKVEKLDLFLHSFGGDVTFPWRLVNLIREYADEYNVIIPLHAFSAATLTSFGADSIVMLPTACLGPTDPASNSPYNPKSLEDPTAPLPISTEDVAYFSKFVMEDLKITTEQGMIEALKLLAQSDNRVHPIALGHAKRGSKLATKYAEELLSLHMKGKTKAAVIKKIVKTFSSDLFAHDHPINRVEAKKLGLNVVQETEVIENKIWELYCSFEKDMELNDPFNPIFEFKKVAPQLQLTQGQNPQVTTKTITSKLAIVETEKRTSTFTRELDVSGWSYIDNTGKINENYSFIPKSMKWQEDVR